MFSFTFMLIFRLTEHMIFCIVLIMEVVIDQSELEFLNGSVSATASYPIKVIKAARERIQTMRAIPQPRYMASWKSLDYRQESGEFSDHGSISIIDDWRMKVIADSGKTPPQITVINIWRLSDVA